MRTPVSLKIANGAGFFGDSIDAPRHLVEAAEVDYLTLEYLAELTLSILARQREKDPRAGYAGDFLRALESLCPALARQSQLGIVTNAGGMNPQSCAAEAAKILAQAGLEHLSIGAVSGDDLLPSLDALQRAGCRLENLDTGQPLAELGRPIASANAYLGARPIADALGQGARIVITGRVADASLTVGPAMHEFGWTWDDWTRLAGASVAGHLIECGAQATGGLYRDWRNLRLADVGYPIAELERDGSCIITKPSGSGGRVSRATVIEQLVYEIGDPAHYLTPDVDVDFTGVEVETADAADRVRVRGAAGRAAPENYKVSLAYRDGYTASGQLLVYGHDAIDKARYCADIVRQRLGRAGCEPQQFHVECLGAGDGVPGSTVDAPAREVMLRIAVRDPQAAVVERFTQELAPLITSGPAGLAGYATGRGVVRPVYAYWPTLVPKELVTSSVEVRSAGQWREGAA